MPCLAGKIASASLFFLLATLLSPLALAASGDLYITTNDMWFDTFTFTEGRTVKISASVHNNSEHDLLGSVRFSNQYGEIADDQPISVLAGSSDDVFINWAPSSEGSYTITATVLPWETDEDDSSNNVTSRTIVVEKDNDGDTIPDATDPDDDNDGVEDTEDDFPYDEEESTDSDGDGTGNNADEDDDNDGTLDEGDAFPTDPMYDSDLDEDNIPDEEDDDIDGDLLVNLAEIEMGTDPLEADSDGDMEIDSIDAFPTDPTEWSDIDSDGTGDNSDNDIDGDGMENEEDPAPSNRAPKASIDQNVFLKNVGEKVVFDASPSLDIDGEIVEYQWEFKKEGITELLFGPVISKSFNDPGLHLATLTVFDDNGQSDTVEVNIRVLNYNFLIWALIFALLLISLAFYLIYRYNRRASEESSEKKPKNSPEKTKKSTKKK